MATMTESSPDVASSPTATVPRWVLAVLALAAAGPVGLLFASRFRQLYELWGIDDNYSHGYFVPLISAYLAIGVFLRQELPSQGSYALGSFLVALGCLLRLVTVLIGLPLVDFLALATTLFGLAVLVGGARWARGFLFPILFLFFMFPLPVAIDLQLAVGLQQIVSSTATWVLQFFMPAYQQGNAILLPGHRLDVGEQCSGLRQIVAFGALTLLIAYFSKRGLAFRLGLVLAGLPVAVVANVLRVLLMAALTMHYGTDAISEDKIIALGISYHEAWGLLTIAVGVVLLAGTAWWLGRMFPSRSLAAGPGPAAPQSAGVSRGQVRGLAAAIVLLAATGFLQQELVAHLSGAEAVVGSSQYLRQPLHGSDGFPMTLGPWRGMDTTPDAISRSYYDKADDKLNRAYTLADDSPERGLTCQLWMIHYHDATDRRHFPTACYRGVGCQEDQSQRDEIALANGEAPAQKYRFTRGKDQAEACNVYYWHYTLEPPESLGLSPLQRIHEAWAIRRPSVTVQITTRGQAPAQLERVAEFVRLVDEELQSHLPPGARRGNESLPAIDLRAPRTGTRPVPAVPGR
jgi:exosortase